MAQNQSASAELERYKLAIEGSNICIWDWMDITKKEQWWSPRFYKMLGYKKGEINSSIDTFKQLLHPNDRDHVFEAIHQHFETAKPLLLEYRLRTKSGSYKWFEASAKAKFDEEGNPSRMAGNVRDINNRKQAKLQVEKERKLLRTIIDNIPANVYVKNVQGEKNTG